MVNTPAKIMPKIPEDERLLIYLNATTISSILTKKIGVLKIAFTAYMYIKSNT